MRVINYGAAHGNEHEDRAGHGDPAPEKGRYGIDQNGGHCPVCTSPAYLDDRFCEACGTPLHTEMAVETGDSDHRELDLGAVAGVCDRGVRHTTNEDAMGVAKVGSTLIAVVCDGVSSTPGSGPAARAAAATATAVLVEAVRGARAERGPLPATVPPAAGGPDETDDHGLAHLVPPGLSDGHRNPVRTTGSERSGNGGLTEDTDQAGYLDHYSGYDEDIIEWPDPDIPTTPPRPTVDEFSPGRMERAMHAAAAAAAAAVARVPAVDGRISPSCTFAAAVITRSSDGAGAVTVGWIGDSRVYLFGPQWFERLTEDDTWAAEAARAGLIPASAVETDRRAHTLTRWLGADAQDVTPHVRVFPLPAPATVLVCTDGLWNYLSHADDMAAVVGQLPADSSAIAIGRHLTRHAIDRGGHDNITVVTARVGADLTGEHSSERDPR
ncbi:protein phosphatase 2C domain-containing protein [Frankia sp. Cppng1_Ct_nod]|uniref:protein phosphatase 2C domain-containing protein n=1 Tax=Frankia sp. Cppng1_Ct_nod TaxID=2897162 RepID=UPI002023F021|nr:protein phosphatase 2C domain-containing protein [Frankia sp. Cppng1_Ct_nod]